MLIINFAQRTRFLLGLGPGLWILLVPLYLTVLSKGPWHHIYDWHPRIEHPVCKLLVMLVFFYEEYTHVLSRKNMQNRRIILLKMMAQQLGACTSFCGWPKFSPQQLRTCTRFCGGPKFSPQQLRAYTTFCGGPKFSLRTHIKQLITTNNSSSIRSDTPGLCGHLLSHAHTHS